MPNYKYGISPPGYQDDVEALAYNASLRNEDCLNSFVELMLTNDCPDDEFMQQELARQAGIDWTLTTEEIQYIENQINSAL